MSKLSDSSCYGKLTQSNTTFMQKLSWEKVIWMDENTLESTIYAWMVTLGDWMMPFQVFLYNSGISSIFKDRRYIKEVLKKEEKTLENKKSEEQEENIPYIYKCYLHF